MTFPPDIVEKVARAIVAKMFELANDLGDWNAIGEDGHEDAHKVATAALEVYTAFSPPSAAVKEEREACAKVAETFGRNEIPLQVQRTDSQIADIRRHVRAASKLIAEDIRSRSALATGNGK